MYGGEQSSSTSPPLFPTSHTPSHYPFHHPSHNQTYPPSYHPSRHPSHHPSHNHTYHPSHFPLPTYSPAPSPPIPPPVTPRPATLPLSPGPSRPLPPAPPARPQPLHYQPLPPVGLSNLPLLRGRQEPLTPTLALHLLTEMRNYTNTVLSFYEAQGGDVYIFLAGSTGQSADWRFSSKYTFVQVNGGKDVMKKPGKEGLIRKVAKVKTVAKPGGDEQFQRITWWFPSRPELVLLQVGSSSNPPPLMLHISSSTSHPPHVILHLSSSTSHPPPPSFWAMRLSGSPWTRSEGEPKSPRYSISRTQSICVNFDIHLCNFF